jgi:uncharacterized membrane protein
MSDRLSLWDFLKEQHQRLVVLGSIVTFGVSVATLLIDKANPPVLSLTFFSALLVVLCGWATFTRLRQKRETEEDSAARPKLLVSCP